MLDGNYNVGGRDEKVTIDAVVGVRQISPIFGRWVAVELTRTNNRVLWVFEEFLHGSIGLESNMNVHYKTTDYYSKNCEAAPRWNDPKLALLWPKFENFIFSQKGQQVLSLSLSSETAR